MRTSECIINNDPGSSTCLNCKAQTECITYSNKKANRQCCNQNGRKPFQIHLAASEHQKLLPGFPHPISSFFLSEVVVGKSMLIPQLQYKKFRMQILKMKATFNRDVSVSVNSSYINLQPACHSWEGFFHEEFTTKRAPGSKQSLAYQGRTGESQSEYGSYW